MVFIDLLFCRIHYFRKLHRFPDNSCHSGKKLFILSSEKNFYKTYLILSFGSQTNKYFDQNTTPYLFVKFI